MSSRARRAAARPWRELTGALLLLQRRGAACWACWPTGCRRRSAAGRRRSWRRWRRWRRARRWARRWARRRRRAWARCRGRRRTGSTRRTCWPSRRGAPPRRRARPRRRRTARGWPRSPSARRPRRSTGPSASRRCRTRRARAPRRPTAWATTRRRCRGTASSRSRGGRGRRAGAAARRPRRSTGVSSSRRLLHAPLPGYILGAPFKLSTNSELSSAAGNKVGKVLSPLLFFYNIGQIHQGFVVAG